MEGGWGGGLLLPLIYPIVAPYVTLAYMWLGPGNNEPVSCEGLSISRAEKFISLVLYAPLGTADSPTRTHTRTQAEIERYNVKSFQQ